MVGRLVSELDARGILENTIIVFASNNDGLAASDAVGHDSSGGFRANSSIYDYEGGHRIPMIVRWDGGGIPAGTTYDHPTGLQDFYATIADLAGTPVPAGQAINSISFKPQLVGGVTAPHRTNLLTQSNGEYAFAVREENWKLILDPDTNPTELYDLASDPFETTNRIADPAQRGRIGRIQEAPIDIISFGTKKEAGHPQKSDLSHTTVVSSPATDANTFLANMLDHIILPRVVFKDASLEDALDFLRIKSRDLDTTTKDEKQKGVPILLRNDAKTPVITG